MALGLSASEKCWLVGVPIRSPEAAEECGESRDWFELEGRARERNRPGMGQ